MRGSERHPPTMRSSLWVVLVAVCASTGCARFRSAAAPEAPGHVGPARDAPHARVLVRVRHHAVLGDIIADAIEIDGRPAMGASDHGGQASGLVRVRPGRRTFLVRTAAFDEATRTAIGYTLVPTEVACCDCDRHVRVTTQEIVTPYLYEAPDIVPTASCEAIARMHAERGGRYVLDYDVYGDGRCELRCRRFDGAVRACE